MATLFDTKYRGRPCLLLFVWMCGIFGCFFLLFGMVIDELTIGGCTAGNGAVEYDVVCKSSVFNREPGIVKQKYKEWGEPETLLQKQAGSAWLAFGILACLFIPFLLFGIITDYYSGKFDERKPIQYFKGCCMLQTWGFTKVSLLFIVIFELLQIIIYSASNRCGSDVFYTEIQCAIDSSKIRGGFSYGALIISLIFFLAIPILILYYQYRVSAELPVGDSKDAPEWYTSRQREPEEPAPKPKKPTAAPPAPSTNQAPESEYFQPKKNVTRNTRPQTMMSEGDFSGANKESQTGAGQHDRALSMLAGGGASSPDGNKTTTKPAGPPPVPPSALR